MYDLHVHIVGHGRSGDYSSVIDSYVLQAELLGLEALGLVDHFPYRVGDVKRVRDKIQEKIQYYKRNADILIVYGAEVYLPSNVRIPKYFDYSLGHIRRGYNLEEAFKMAKQKNVDIIAHPCAYGSFCTESIEEYTSSKTALELSEKTLTHLPQWLYEKAVSLNIPLTLGSDAHIPEEMGFYGVVERKLKWTPLSELPFVEERRWL